jgi:pantoate--beta-alanine ligase
MVVDLNLPIEIAVCPTVREPDGPALSSRNRYLSPTEREQALAISRAIDLAERMVAGGETRADKIVAAMRNTLSAAGIEKIDYVALADARSLAEVSELQNPAVALIAAFIGTTRLIDNRILSPLPARERENG